MSVDPKQEASELRTLLDKTIGEAERLTEHVAQFAGHGAAELSNAVQLLEQAKTWLDRHVAKREIATSYADAPGDEASSVEPDEPPAIADEDTPPAPPVGDQPPAGDPGGQGDGGAGGPADGGSGS